MDMCKELYEGSGIVYFFTETFHDNFRKTIKCLIPTLDYFLFTYMIFPLGFYCFTYIIPVLKETWSILYYLNSKTVYGKGIFAGI